MNKILFRKGNKFPTNPFPGEIFLNESSGECYLYDSNGSFLKIGTSELDSDTNSVSNKSAMSLFKNSYKLRLIYDRNKK